ncbi:F-box protein SKIP19-like [Arachis stenosperma]|uniref:F-box protein SKIP19-like n=1 Tax=Arachis stenosperma TaxID=217475 RepID=UPI0025AD6C06|nr:F-box protein SKIP19-like [Arachis stenosperma]
MDYRSILARPAKKINWLDLPHDLTLMIIGKLTTFQILTSVQFVCRIWHRICMDPLMWRTINMCDIGVYDSVDYKLGEMCRHAIDRSCGLLVDITIKYFGTDDLLKYIINSGCYKLRHLRLVKCYRISDKGLCEMAEKLSLLEELDITPCFDVSSIALEAIGRGCPLLKSFKFNNGSICEGNGQAFAIAQNMSNLHHLQLVGNCLDNSGLSAIFDGCSHLESLDLRYCYYVELEGILRTRCDEQLKDFRDPDAPLDFQFWERCYNTTDDDALDEYLHKKRVKKQEAERAEKEKRYTEAENLDEANWEEIYAIWECIKNPRLLYKGLIPRSSRGKKNNAKIKWKKKHGRKECKINNRKSIFYEMKDAHELLQSNVFFL